MNIPPGPHTITTTENAVTLSVRDPQQWSAWLAEQIRIERANAVVRRQPPPPHHEIHPIITQLRAIRVELGATCETVSRAMLMDRARVACYERGGYRPRMDTVDAWAYVLGHRLRLTPIGEVA